MTAAEAIESAVRRGDHNSSDQGRHLVVSAAALLYDFGWLSSEVAAELHVNESRVSQIKQGAISKLRLQLESGPARRAA